MLTTQELKKLSAEELIAEFTKATKELFKIRFDVNNGSSKAHNKVRNMRKYRAQIKTAQYELNAAKPIEKPVEKVEPVKEEKPSKK